MPSSPSSPSLKHELRTPLNHIIGCTEMLLEDASAHGDASCVADPGKIHAAANPLLELVMTNFNSDRIAALVSFDMYRLNSLCQGISLESGHADFAPPLGVF